MINIKSLGQYSQYNTLIIASFSFILGFCISRILNQVNRDKELEHETEKYDEDNNDLNRKLLSCSYVKLIGKTPIIKLNKLSSLLRRNIYVKMECLNPGGTGKDRAAKSMIQSALKQSKSIIKSEQILNIVEGTSGSTG